MSSPASVKGHPLHPMLIVFPIGLWVFSLVADLVYHWDLGSYTWSVVAYYTMAGGIAGALLAAIPGLIDLLSMSDGKAKRIGIAHMVVNLVVVALYVVNLYIRSRQGHDETIAVALSVVGVGLLSLSGWLGGELVYIYGVAVEEHHEPAEHRR
jgi:uncharacterized membrane protein